MIVYVVIEEWHHEGCQLLGVFSTPTLAMDAFPGEWNHYDDNRFFSFRGSSFSTRLVITPTPVDRAIGQVYE